MEKYEEKKKITVEQNLIYIQDIEAFFEHVCAERNLDPQSCVFRIGMDSGQVDFSHWFQ